MYTCTKEKAKTVDQTKLKEAIRLGFIKETPTGYELTMLGLAQWGTEQMSRR